MESAAFEENQGESMGRRGIQIRETALAVKRTRQIVPWIGETWQLLFFLFISQS
jgi:hypothetical protein